MKRPFCQAQTFMGHPIGSNPVHQQQPFSLSVVLSLSRSVTLEVLKFNQRDRDPINYTVQFGNDPCKSS